ncbi:8772_t:CDS:2 [Funneliformis geosporum]|uniref:13462_t:CDS:1 n=1 Tax=Funneliformis geosporum TaxID=1117311 RepID=A0A9W4STX7_9GLOM|nr:8772_t:CDS:2 [Funneliformis geosporum]CAI2181326.1 13462_t:CDS:2 [Funneliformis geosporum]
MEKQYSIPFGPETEGETRIRRSILSPNQLLNTPVEGVNTLYDVFQYSVKTHGTKNAFGTRKVEKIIEEEKEVTKIVNGEEKKEIKKWKFFQLSSYNWINYEEAAKITSQIGAGLVKLGLQKDAKVTIFASTSANWMLVTHGCFTQSMTIVTAYDTLGEEGLLHSMNETEVHALFTNADLLPIIGRVAGKCSTLEHVIYDGEAKGNILDELKEKHPNLKLYTLDELKQLGKDNPIDSNPPSPDDLCCIMYTSGSTGNPKGVLLAHSNLVAAISGINKMLQTILQPDDSLLAYLPLAHVLEFTVEHVCIFWGVSLGYGTIRTLTDASVRNCLGDINEFKPSLMTGVPAVWESIRKGVLSKVNAGSPALQRVFYAAFKAKGWLMSKGLPTRPLDIAFNKIKQQTGGRLRYALSGGAPISKETQEFLSIALCPILQGYGMTESCGMCAVMPPEQFAYGTVGSPVPCLEIKLVDVSEAGYKSTNTPNPQGEILVRGPVITKGYYKNESLSKETINDDGWLQTGDIGEWHQNGTLAIIDRKKNLVKLSHGEYIALERLESVYKSTMFVSNICVCADSFQSRPVALIYPFEDRLREVAKEKNLGNLDFEQLCANKEINSAVFQACLAQAKKADFKPAELLSAVSLVTDEWTAQNGLLTAAQKIKRKDLQQKYKAEIDRMYEKSS